MNIRDFQPADLDWIHALNQANGRALSFMERGAFSEMIARARFARVIEPEAAFLLVYDKAPTLDSPNFDWLKAHFPAALYIDRIAVAAHARGQGYARALYEDLFQQAAAGGVHEIGCEVNVDPPNPASDAFHAALGFEPVGEARLEGRNKTVRYFLRREK